MMFVIGFLLGGLLVEAVRRAAEPSVYVNRGTLPIVEKIISDAKARKGIIIQAEDERDIAREKVLEENRKRGVDTKLEELS